MQRDFFLHATKLLILAKFSIRHTKEKTFEAEKSISLQNCEGQKSFTVRFNIKFILFETDREGFLYYKEKK